MNREEPRTARRREWSVQAKANIPREGVGTDLEISKRERSCTIRALQNEGLVPYCGCGRLGEPAGRPLAAIESLLGGCEPNI